MRLLVVFPVLLAASCSLPSNVFYQCEPDGSCAVPGTVCMSDHVCRPDPDAGRADAGVDAGASDAGPGDGGCVPLTVATACGSTVECGFVSDGCGGELDCDRWCPAPQQCGVREPNRCALPSLCLPDGWCWEYPLPQGLTINAAWRADARHTWFVGEHGLILFFDGEKMSLQEPPQGLEKESFEAVHGASPTEVFAVGTGGAIAHFDGVRWERESGLAALTANLHGVWSFGGGRALVVGSGSRVLSRSASAAAPLRWAAEPFPSTGGGELREVLADDKGRAYVVALSGELFSRPPGSNTNWARLDEVPLQATLAAIAVGEDLVFGGGSAQKRQPLVKRSADAGWSVVNDAGLVVTEFVRGDGGTFALGGVELGWLADDGSFTRFGAQGGQWNAGVALEGPRLLAGGVAGGMALVAPDGLDRRLSSPRVLPNAHDWNALCGHGPAGIYALGGAELAGARVQWLERAPTAAGVDWSLQGLALGNTTVLHGCLSESPTRTWFTGNDSMYIQRDAQGRPMPRDFGPGLAGNYTSMARITDAGFALTREGESTLVLIDTDGNAAVKDIMAPAPLNALWADGTRLVVVGNNGAVGRTPLGTQAWSWQSATASLVALHGARLSDGNSRLVAAGGSTVWSDLDNSVPMPGLGSLQGSFLAVWVSASGRAWAGGATNDGAPLLYTSASHGALWLPVPLDVPREVRGVFGLDLPDGGVTLWVAGTGGMVLRR
ncbi:MAG: WD40/YVTN/BNR-like repeat-containing protein [Myxococcota bacterium]